MATMRNWERKQTGRLLGQTRRVHKDKRAAQTLQEASNAEVTAAGLLAAETAMKAAFYTA